MRVNIVCYEDVNVWILGKFARMMHENLVHLGVESKISKESDPLFEINHHIININFNNVPSSIDTLMITHVDDSWKLNLIKKQLEMTPLGICMSKETMQKLITLGIPSDRITYVNPAHDGIIKSRKIVIGITCFVQNDGRKREVFLDKLAKEIDHNIFKFKIMGRNWDPQVKTLRSVGFEVNYDSEFNYEKYIELIPSLDYYLYMGQDEGQMGFLDALAAGVKTIVTPQGYHLDAQNGITHPFNSYEELLSIFENISKEKLQLINSVKDWNWEKYTMKHLEIWKYLISKKNNLPFNIPSENKYEDGIFPLIQSSHSLIKGLDKGKETFKLRKEYVRHLVYKIKDKISQLLFRKKKYRTAL